MFAPMKTQTTGGSTEITFTVPNEMVDNVTAIIQNILSLTQKKSGEEIEDDKVYPIEQFMDEITPGRALLGLRYREDLTQKQFAEKLGIKQSHVSEMENNRRPISLQMAKKISKIFGVGYKVFL